MPVNIHTEIIGKIRNLRFTRSQCVNSAKNVYRRGKNDTKYSSAYSQNHVQTAVYLQRKTRVVLMEKNTFKKQLFLYYKRFVRNTI